MFLARYAMAPFLSRLVCSVDQLDDPRPQVGVGAVSGLAFDSVPHHLCEPARDRAAAAVGRVAGDVEADPADDVVDGVGPRAGQGVVDGEEQLRLQALLER